MNLGLKQAPYSDKIQQIVQTTFGGYDCRIGQGDGSIADDSNMTANDYPVLSTRNKIELVHSLGTASDFNGIHYNDALIYVIGTSLYIDHVLITTVEDSYKTFASIGDRTIMFPDKLVINGTTVTSLEATLTSISCKIKTGTYKEEEAEANTIERLNPPSGFSFLDSFKVGDAITISGATTHTSNNQTLIVREVTATELRFYPNSFTITAGGDTETLTLSRTVPDLDYVIENNNRIWGCKDSTIYASKLGDPTNWNVFDGLSTDSYAVDVGEGGSFTGCVSYLGYPIFMKEDHIYKVYGNKPSNFEVTKSATLGCKSGSDRSYAIAGETLYYNTPQGIAAYTGGIPSIISQPLGDGLKNGMFSGSDGRRLYVTFLNASNTQETFVYDTQFGVWHKETFGTVQAYVFTGNLDIVVGGNLYKTPDSPSGSGTKVDHTSFVEFGDFTDGSPNKKHTTKVLVRLEYTGTITISIKYDNGSYSTIYTETDTFNKQSIYIPLIIHRCDHFRIKIEGTNFKLYSLTRELSTGSPNK